MSETKLAKLMKRARGTKWSQTDIALIAKVHPQFISNWERSRASIPVHRAKLLIEEGIFTRAQYVFAALYDYRKALKKELE